MKFRGQEFLLDDVTKNYIKLYLSHLTGASEIEFLYDQKYGSYVKDMKTGSIKNEHLSFSIIDDVATFFNFDVDFIISQSEINRIKAKIPTIFNDSFVFRRILLISNHINIPKVVRIFNNRKFDQNKRL